MYWTKSQHTELNLLPVDSVMHWLSIYLSIWLNGSDCEKWFCFEKCYKKKSSEQTAVSTKYAVLNTNHPFLKYILIYFFVSVAFGMMAIKESFVLRTLNHYIKYII